ncbi:hypothetical protein BGZ63DRAFT_231183 [Mariannaea sp. PMI_226]|nr:hypothetical protein BGZ63DRAFT_231183 [Mariannaea sp. PMI_226]
MGKGREISENSVAGDLCGMQALAGRFGPCFPHSLSPSLCVCGFSFSLLSFSPHSLFTRRLCQTGFVELVGCVTGDGALCDGGDRQGEVGKKAICKIACVLYQSPSVVFSIIHHLSFLCPRSHSPLFLSRWVSVRPHGPVGLKHMASGFFFVVSYLLYFI